MSRRYLEHIDFLSLNRTSQRYYTGIINGLALTTLAMTANRLYAIPFLCSEPLKIDQIAINVTTLAAGSARLGVYADDRLIRPGRLVLDAGEVDTGATGVKTLSVTLDLLRKQLYWLAIVANAAPTVRAPAAGSCYPIYGVDSSLGTAVGTHIYRAFTYGALPDPFGTPPFTIGIGSFPAVFVRIV